MIVYKLTDQSGQTYNETQWGPGVEHAANGPKVVEKRHMCTEFAIHAYETPELAILMNPIHAKFNDPILWEAEYVDCELCSDGLKLGGHQLRTIRAIDKPNITTEHRVRFAIMCAMRVYHNDAFTAWATGWLNGADRSADAAARAALRSADAAARAARAALRAADAADVARAADAAWAARSADAAARAALRAADVAWAARSADAAARAADVAADAAWAADAARIAAADAAWAADAARIAAAARYDESINYADISRQAVYGEGVNQ